MIRLFNRIGCMNNERLPRRILTWDYKCKAKGWLGELLSVCTTVGIPIPDEIRFIYDMEPIKHIMVKLNRDEWRNAAENMSKLCTYVKIRDFCEIGQLVLVKLKRNHGSLMARLLCGILPLEVETGCYTDIKKDLRVCKICNCGKLEDKVHFLFHCSKFEGERESLIDPLLQQSPETESMSEFEKLRWLIDRSQVKDFAVSLAGMYQARQDYLYK